MTYISVLSQLQWTAITLVSVQLCVSVAKHKSDIVKYVFDKKKQLNHIQIEAVTEILKPFKLFELLYNIFSKLKVEKYCWSCWNQLQSARFIQQIRSVYLIFQGLEGPHNGVALLLLASGSGLLLWEETTVLSYQRYPCLSYFA